MRRCGILPAFIRALQSNIGLKWQPLRRNVPLVLLSTVKALLHQPTLVSGPMSDLIVKSPCNFSFVRMTSNVVPRAPIASGFLLSLSSSSVRLFHLSGSFKIGTNLRYTEIEALENGGFQLP